MVFPAFIRTIFRRKKKIPTVSFSRSIQTKLVWSSCFFFFSLSTQIIYTTGKLFTCLLPILQFSNLTWTPLKLKQMNSLIWLTNKLVWSSCFFFFSLSTQIIYTTGKLFTCLLPILQFSNLTWTPLKLKQMNSLIWLTKTSVNPCTRYHLCLVWYDFSITNVMGLWWYLQQKKHTLFRVSFQVGKR